MTTSDFMPIDKLPRERKLYMQRRFLWLLCALLWALLIGKCLFSARYAEASRGLSELNFDAEWADLDFSDSIQAPPRKASQTPQARKNDLETQAIKAASSHAKFLEQERSGKDPTSASAALASSGLAATQRASSHSNDKNVIFLSTKSVPRRAEHSLSYAACLSAADELIGHPLLLSDEIHAQASASTHKEGPGSHEIATQTALASGTSTSALYHSDHSPANIEDTYNKNSRAASSTVSAAVSTKTEHASLNLNLDEAGLCAALQEALRAHYQVYFGDLRVYLMKDWSPIQVNAHNWHLQLLDAPASGIAFSSPLRFKLYSGEKCMGDFRMNVQCNLWVPALVATRSLKAATPLNLQDFKVQIVDLLRQRVPVIDPSAIPFDHELSKNLTPGRILSWNDIAPVPLVRKGDPVDVAAMHESLTVSLKAQALENGQLGDLIDLRNPFSKRNFKAQVIGTKRVRVTL